MPVTTPPTIDTLPPAPVRGQAGFSDATGLFLEALPDFGDQMQAAGEATADNAQVALDAATATEAAQVTSEAAAQLALETSGYAGTSSTPNTIGTGAKSFHMDVAGLLFEDSMALVAFSKSNPDNRLYGDVSSWDGVDDVTITVPVGGTSGSGGPYDDWIVAAAGFFQSGATAAEILAAASDFVAISPLSLKSALVPFALTDQATVTPDNASGLDFTWTIGGNRTLGAITNTYPGARGTIEITQDGTGSRVLAWASCYKRRGGLAVLSTATGTKDYLIYEVKTVNGSNVATLVIVSFIKAPTN